MDVLGIYIRGLKDLQDYKLTREEELHYAEAWRNGDEDARQCLINSCLPWVVRIAKKCFTHDPARNLDIIQEGNIGLMSAVDKFQPWNFKTRLTTYSAYWINQAIQRHLSEERGGVIHIPYHIVDSNGLPEDDDAHDTVETLLRCALYSTDLVIGSNKLDEGPANTVGASLPDTREPTAAEKEEQDEQARRMARFLELLQHLDDRERYILLARMRGGKENTLDAVGKRMGITRERVRQLEAGAKEKLIQLHEAEPAGLDTVEITAVARNFSGGVAMLDEQLDPLEVLEQITPHQVAIAIAKNEEVLSQAKVVHRRRADYLKQLKQLVDACEGLKPLPGKRATNHAKKSSPDIVAEFLIGKGSLSSRKIINGTHLTKMQVLISLRKNRDRFCEQDDGNWSLK